ncbi:MAG: DNA repair protein RadA [Gammaproteobacteria bacterium]|nr:DNA repair protein RadA [Gammaproteobacteria bacterium]
MAKARRIYVCSSCDAQTPQWSGQCSECGAWNSLEEARQSGQRAASPGQYAGESQVVALDQIEPAVVSHRSTGIKELDRVLGGGLVQGAAVLIGGDPGIGKSTLLLQMVTALDGAGAESGPGLYVTAEESVQQVALRAERLNLPRQNTTVMAESDLDRILVEASRSRPEVVVVDSIQALVAPDLTSAAGSVSQVRECAARLVRFAKQSGTVVFIVGHVTKEGALAGPRVLEHMVDTVLYFEGESSSRYRLLRAVKNRFGAANELGVFAMSDRGLKAVGNPSAIFLTRHEKPVPGSVVMGSLEGTRPMLVEIQALAEPSHLGSPRRVCVGLEPQRLAMLGAVMHRHLGVTSHDLDLFVNVVGGLKVSETGVDLPVLVALLSSIREKALPQDLVIFGEIGLAGEVRPVRGGLERLKEAAGLGFQRALVSEYNSPKPGQAIKGLRVHGIRNVGEVGAWFSDLKVS